MKNIEKENTLAGLCSMLHEALQVNIDIYDRTYNLILSFQNPKTAYSPIVDAFFKQRIVNYETYYDEARKRLENISREEVILYHHRNLHICELDFKISAPNEPLLFAAVGPFLTQEANDLWLQRFLSDQKLLKTNSLEYTEIRNYYMQLPFLSNRMESIATLILHTLSHRPNMKNISFYTITETQSSSKSSIPSDSMMEDVFKHSENLTMTATREYSLRNAVMQGDSTAALEELTSLYMSYQSMLFGSSPHERQLHFLNYLNTLSRTACTDGGGDSFRAFKLSQSYALRASQIQNPLDISKLSTEMLNSYCELVLDAKSQQYSVLVKAAASYIHSEYRKNLTLSLVAKETFVSESHLSRLFKAETGMTIREYLNYTRIQQAIGLFQTARYPITEIALMVGFSSYAKFSVEFKKYTGMNAREYKQIHFYQSSSDDFS